MTFFSFKKKSPKTGVTLTELLVVISIITIISTIMVINFRAGEKGGELVRSAQLVVQGIRKAQSMALGSKENKHPTTDNWEVPEGSYGVYIALSSPNQYIIFADFFVADPDTENDQYNSGEDIETVELEGGIIIEHIRYQPSNGKPNKTNINFDPIDPLINLVPPMPPANEINITLKREEVVDCGSDCQEGVVGSCPEGCKVVKLLKAGWVSIVD